MTQAYRDKNEFVILIDGELKTFDKYEDIPEVFDNVIKFLPAFPPEPHTEEQHKELPSTWVSCVKQRHYEWEGEWSFWFDPEALRFNPTKDLNKKVDNFDDYL